MLGSLWSLLFAFGQVPATIRTDETVVFFSTTAHFDPQAQLWRVPIHAWIFEPEPDSTTRRFALAALEKSLGLEPAGAQAQVFARRAAPFLADNERGKEIGIRLGGATRVLNMSEANGHSTTRLSLSQAEGDALAAAADNGWVSYAAILPRGDARRFEGGTQFLRPEGLSVVSDVDDTIKISEVRNKPRLLARTFLEEFEAAPGMAAAYRRLASRGASFHFVTASPWQLYPDLEAFRRTAGFPAADWHMKLFRVKDNSFASLFSDPVQYKLGAIEPLFERFPRRQFLLIGDTGEKDPEVYGELARQHPGQVRGVWLRDVTSEPADAERYASAFRDVPRERWKLFADGAEIEP